MSSSNVFVAETIIWKKSDAMQDNPDDWDARSIWMELRFHVILLVSIVANVQRQLF